MRKKQLVKPDIVIVSSLSIFTILNGIILKILYKSKLVFEIRDIWPLTMTEEAGFSKWHPLVLFIGWIEKIGYKKADLIVGTMPRLDLHVKNILGFDKRCFCSPLGFNPENYTDEEIHGINLNQTLGSNKIVIGYAGSMGLTNALDAFVKAIKLIYEKNSNIHFILVGSGDYKEKFRKELEGFSNTTIFDRIPQNEVKNFLKSCDILYLSTHKSKVWDFGQSMNKVVEYMLSGKPIVASYTGYPSMINEADCGVFVQSDSAEDLANTFLYYANMRKDDRNIIGLNGKKWIHENRQYSKLANDYFDKLKELFSSV